MPVFSPPYVGRFAPSPTGPLHTGSVVAALGSWLDARAHAGRWLVRLEDVDTPRCPAGLGEEILRQLAVLGLQPDDAVTWQSKTSARYETALADLVARNLAYPCACTRKELAATQPDRTRHHALTYPGTCRPERGGLHGRPARAWRFRVPSGVQQWNDRRLGPMEQDVVRDVGDFVLRRADGLWAYQLAVVVDDGAQGITDVVRGSDLADNTPRQIQLQQALGLPRPRYLHLPLVLAPDGQKLSKQNGAAPFDEGHPLAVLHEAAGRLGLTGLPTGANRSDWLAQAVRAWADQTQSTMDPVFD
ncbi:tRNA glutamyl-Q(34) synthetase GluQRS [Inhella gelatinilytica]|uniref:Glutamyl-Q tRNA(Asp) synthetase n=1 Tax=Inhella gelatinilytica TaxID=2795030 RepID=A0A931J194_9BURK|nr:tRNA glutamyl-Q(34) synthetase GluQRS [Inhella gelatinilytica]MBH9553516.1 tRNA glutamyl-Q(34) synthetase GluQRS [Inhella gelatinilytica]